jgi:flagellin-like protein
MRNKMAWGRKGVSPLIATVVLIGFAVSLGAVVMSWGKTALEKTSEPTVPDEGTGNLAWYMGSNIENVCYTDDAIQMTLKGSPKINIRSIFIASEGSQDYIYADPIQLPEDANQNVNVRVPYNSTKYGDISKLILGGVDTALITTEPKRCPQ